MTTGYELLQIAEQNRQWVAQERSVGPKSCPNDGTPLQPASGGGRHCPFDGYRWPQDGWGDLGEPC